MFHPPISNKSQRILFESVLVQTHVASLRGELESPVWVVLNWTFKRISNMEANGKQGKGQEISSVQLLISVLQLCQVT